MTAVIHCTDLWLFKVIFYRFNNSILNLFAQKPKNNKNIEDNRYNLFDWECSCLKLFIYIRILQTLTGTGVDRPAKIEKAIQTDDIPSIDSYKETIELSRTLEEAERTLNNRDYLRTQSEHHERPKNLVGYDISEESNSENEDTTQSFRTKKNNNKRLGFDIDNFLVNKQYFDNQENKLINEITQRISQKRKCEEILPYRTKICKFDINNRRKNRQPKKINTNKIVEDVLMFDSWCQQEVAANDVKVESDSFLTGDSALSNGGVEVTNEGVSDSFC